MKRKIFKAVICFAIAAMMLSSQTLTVFGENMAFNLYANPVTTGTSGVYDTFTIDFRSGMTPNYTYWALANFGLYFSKDTMKKYKQISGGGAYAGMQNTSPSQGRVGIMSFWEMSYRNSSGQQIMTATRVFPSGESTFGGEGEGTNIIAPFAWEDNKWYRMVLHAWEDTQTNTTFVGQWFQDVETGEWTLFSYFDTHLINSALKGGMGLFMENYVGRTRDQVREFNIKNIYAVDHEDKKWKSFDKSVISYGNGGANNKEGGHEFGATEEYFWGKSGGAVEDQAAYDAASVKEKLYSIKQPETPTFGAPAISGAEFTKTDGKLKIEWTCPKTNTPQLSYTVEAFGIDGESLFKKSETRPEITSCVLDGLDTEAVKCVVTVRDVFGAETTCEAETEAYTNGGKVDPTPSKDPSEEPSNAVSGANSSGVSPSEPSGGDEEEKNSLPVIIGCVAAVAGVVAVIAVVAVIFFKKKR